MSGTGNLSLKKTSGVALIIPLLFFVWVLQVRIDQIRPSEAGTENFLLYLPSGNYLKTITLGYRELAADLLWIKTVDYFGNHYATDRSYTWLYHMLDLVTTLDPRFVFAFHFGAIVLSIEADQMENSEKLLEKAIRLHPTVWQFPFYLGYNLYFHKKDFKGAARYIGIASWLPGSPGYLRGFAARLDASTGEASTGLMFLRELYRNTQDKGIRREIQKKIEELSRGQSGVSDKNR